MPDVRLSEDFQGHKAGEIVSLSLDELSKAYDARVVGKLYPTAVVGAGTGGRRRAAKKAPTRRAAKKTAPPETEASTG